MKMFLLFFERRLILPSFRKLFEKKTQKLFHEILLLKTLD